MFEDEARFKIQNSFEVKARFETSLKGNFEAEEFFEAKTSKTRFYKLPAEETS